MEAGETMTVEMLIIKMLITKMGAIEAESRRGRSYRDEDGRSRTVRMGISWSTAIDQCGRS